MEQWLLLKISRNGALFNDCVGREDVEFQARISHVHTFNYLVYNTRYQLLCQAFQIKSLWLIFVIFMMFTLRDKFT